MCLTLCNPVNCSTPGFSVLHYLPEFAQTHVHWVNDAIQPSDPLSPPSPFALSLPSIRVFSSELALCTRWPKYWSFSFSISPANEYSGLISWFDLLAVLGNFKCLLQHHSLKASILRCSAFFMVQFSHPYMTTGKTKALTIWTFVSKRMSLSTNSSKWSQTIGGDTFCFSYFWNLFYWSIVDLQCHVSFICTAKWFSYIYICIHFFVLFSIMAY